MPVNMYVGTNDPLLSSGNLEEQLKIAEQRLAALQELRSRREVPQDQTPLWNAIDKEIEPLTDEQRAKLQNSGEYMELYTQLNALVQTALVDLVKGSIERSEEGRRLLEAQLKVIKDLKGKIIKDSEREMELFRKFKEYSSSNPGATYEEFLKTL